MCLVSPCLGSLHIYVYVYVYIAFFLFSPFYLCAAPLFLFLSRVFFNISQVERAKGGRGGGDKAYVLNLIAFMYICIYICVCVCVSVGSGTGVLDG